MYKVLLTNVEVEVEEEFDTLPAAVDKARSIGFECSITRDGDIVGSYSPISGFSPIDKWLV
jgi:hypothetical protein